MPELYLLLLAVFLLTGLMSGYPVAFVLGGVSLIVAGIAGSAGAFDLAYISALPNRIYGIMTNDLLIAVPLFVFMGVMLERARIAEELLSTMTRLFGGVPAGLGLSVLLVGTLLAASTGIVGATVVTMGLISLPVMLRNRYSPQLSCGIICAAGTLGQIIPPSIVLILLGDQISNAYQSASMAQGNLAAGPVSIADLFMGAILPGFLLVTLYAVWLLLYSRIYPQRMPAVKQPPIGWRAIVKILVPPIILILLVLGSILSGITTATESASIGAVGAMVLAYVYGRLNLDTLRDTVRETTKVSCMVFSILIGATLFTLVFRGLGGDDVVHGFFTQLPGGLFGAMLLAMLIMFLLGFFLDFIEIIFVVVPIIAPVLLLMGADPVWLAIMIAINLQTSFLTPPFGFSLFYLRGVAPRKVKTLDIYKGVIPFVGIQLLVLMILASVPTLATWLPEKVYGREDVAIDEKPLDAYLLNSYTVDY